MTTKTTKTTTNTKAAKANTEAKKIEKVALQDKLNIKLSATQAKAFSISNTNKNGCSVYNVFYVVDTKSNSRVIECWSKKGDQCELVISAQALSDKELESMKDQTNQKRKNVFVSNTELAKYIEGHLESYTKKLAKVVE